MNIVFDIEWMTGLISNRGKKNLLASVYTGSGADSFSYLMAIEDPLPGGKAQPRHDADYSTNLTPLLRMSMSYLLLAQEPLWPLEGQRYFT